MSTIFISHSSSDNALARELGERLAQQNHHSVFLDFDPEQGIVAGQSWEHTLYRKLRACRAVIVLCTDHYLNSQWCFAEIALARMEGKHIVALQVDPLSEHAKLPSILTERQFIDLRTNPEEGYRRLWKGLKEQDLLGVAGEWNPKKPPYLGLSAYQEEHAPVFFGREDESRAGLELLSRGAPGLIMVLGSSGSGKSSLVRAGMLPRIRREQGQWLVVDPFRPGGDPYIELAESLVQTWRRYAPEHAARIGNAEQISSRLAAWAPLSSSAAISSAPPPESSVAEPAPGADERIARLIRHIEELRDDPPAQLQDGLRHFLDWSLEDLQRIAGDWAPSAATVAGEDTTPLVELARELQRDAGQRNARVLLIVDQFEENLDHEGADHKANRFLGLLRASLEADHSPLMALGTMRSDFLGMFQRNSALRGIDFESLSLGPMRLDGMRRVIEEPAKLSALELETGLADRLIADTETPDALPLLSFTLSVLWRDYREDGRLEVSEYEQLGGLNGAIAGEADALLAAAKKEGKEEALRTAFLRMARLTEEGGYARQPVAWDAEELRPVHPILERFVGRRLLVTRAEGGTRMVEVAHEALFRSWTPLKIWLDNSRAELLLLQQIERDAKIWQQSNRAPENLWRGGRLQGAQELVRKYQLAEPERKFVRAGLRRRRLMRMTLAGTTLAVIAVLAGFLVYALLAADRAAKATDIANSGRLASASLLSRVDRPDRASLLAIEALHVADTFDARNALLLALQSKPSLEVILDDRTSVRSVAFAPDGKTLALANFDTTVRLWRQDESGWMPFGQPLDTKSTVNSVAFAPDGGTLASASPDDALRLWRQDESGWTPSGEFMEDEVVTSFAFAPDGKTLAAGNVDGFLWLFRLDETGWATFGETMEGHRDMVNSVAFAPDGKTLASASADRTLRLWRLDKTGWTSLGERMEGQIGEVRSVAFAPDGKTVAAGGTAKTVRLWRLDETGWTPFGEPIEGEIGWVNSIAFAPDGKTLAAGGTAKTVRLWRLDKTGWTPFGEPMEGQIGGVNSVAFAPDGKTLASASEDGTLWLWRLHETGWTPFGEPMGGQKGDVNSIAFAPNGKTLAAGSEDHTVRLWRLDETGWTSFGEPMEGEIGWVNSVAFAPDGKILAAGGTAKTVRLWRLDETGWTPFGEPMEGQIGGVNSVAFAPDGKSLAAGGTDTTVRLWRLDESGWTPFGEPLQVQIGKVNSVAFAPNGKTLAAGSENDTVRLWRLDETGWTPFGEPMEGEIGWVNSVAFAPDGKILAAGGTAKTVRLWRLDETGWTPLGEPMEGHRDMVNSVAFAPDGKTLASASADKTVRLWRLDETGLTSLGEPLAGHDGAVLSVAFAPDGRTLASGSDDNTVRLWQHGIESWKVAACRRTGTNFSMAEWKKYVGANEPYRCTCPSKGPGEGAPACPGN